VYLDFF